MRAMEMNEEARLDLLRRRASRLAVPVSNEAESESALEILVFTLSGERYALPIDKVGSVAPCLRLCPIPGTPDHILGIAHVGGELLPVVDLGPRFGLGRGVPGRDSRIIVLENESMKFGLFAELVVGSRLAGRSELNPPLQQGCGPASYLLNVMSDGTVLINADAILSDDSLVVRDE